MANLKPVAIADFTLTFSFIRWSEETGRLQFIGSQRVGHD